jgi:hypothetical protein
MFGSFLDQFGLNFQLPDQSVQSGLFGANAPQQGQPPLGGPAAPGGAGTGLNMLQPSSGAAKAPPGATAPGTITPPPAATNPGAGSAQAPPGVTTSSPLGSPLAPGAETGFQNQAPDPAPAAGVGNQFANGKAGF